MFSYYSKFSCIKIYVVKLFSQTNEKVGLQSVTTTFFIDITKQFLNGNYFSHITIINTLNNDHN